jgi:hypothetical protein
LGRVEATPPPFISIRDGANLNLPLAYAACFLTGVAYAMAGRDLTDPDVFVDRWFLALVIFQSVVFTPFFLYWTVFYPDWSVMYLFEPVRPVEEIGLGWLFSAVGMILGFALAILGYAYGRKSLLHGIGPHAVVVSAAFTTVLLVLNFVFYRRFIYAGSMTQFRDGSARLIFTSIPGLTLAVYIALLPLGIAFWKKMYSRKWGGA